MVTSQLVPVNQAKSWMLLFKAYDMVHQPQATISLQKTYLARQRPPMTGLKTGGLPPHVDAADYPAPTAETGSLDFH